MTRSLFVILHQSSRWWVPVSHTRCISHVRLRSIVFPYKLSIIEASIPDQLNGAVLLKHVFVVFLISFSTWARSFFLHVSVTSNLLTRCWNPNRRIISSGNEIFSLRAMHFIQWHLLPTAPRVVYMFYPCRKITTAHPLSLNWEANMDGWLRIKRDRHSDIQSGSQ